jgi:anthranilate phosphoribosyltransferase
VVVDAEPLIVERCISHARIGFLFAPRFHAATRYAGSARKELGIRTMFNLLGPLTNPAFVHHQVVGVYDRAWCEPLAAALGALGLRRAAVVHGAGNLDEIAVRGETHVAIWDDGVVDSLTLTPKMFGLDEVDPVGLAGGDAAFNANILKKVLAGYQVDHGERFEAVLHAGAMTAALALELLEPGALDLDRLPDQAIRAATVARDGEARLALHRFAEASHAPLDADLSDLAAKTAADFRGVE